MNMGILRIFLGYNLTSNMCMLWDSNMSTVADPSWKTHYNWRIYGLFIKTNKECSISTSFHCYVSSPEGIYIVGRGLIL